MLAFITASVYSTRGLKGNSSITWRTRYTSPSTTTALLALKGMPAPKVFFQLSESKAQNDQVWRLTVLGASRPASRIAAKTSSSISLEEKSRTDRRFSTACRI
jgi:hypothetical protein